MVADTTIINYLIRLFSIYVATVNDFLSPLSTFPSLSTITGIPLPPCQVSMNR